MTDDKRLFDKCFQCGAPAIFPSERNYVEFDGQLKKGAQSKATFKIKRYVCNRCLREAVFT